MSPCYHSLLTVTQKYHSKMTPIAQLHADKTAKAFVLYAFRIAFPASLFNGWYVHCTVYCVTQFGCAQCLPEFQTWSFPLYS